MNIINTMQLLLAVIKQGGIIAKDALRDISGGSLSYNPDVVMQPDYLSAIINRYGVEPLSTAVDISAIERLAIPSISSNCNNTVIRLQQSPDSQLPDRLFIKLPSPSLLTHLFINLVGAWKVEAYFCRHIAHTLPIRTPKNYAVATQGSRFCLVQEDLNSDPSVTLFTNFTMLAGPSITQAKQCLDTFARLHALHYAMSETERLKILPLDHHPFFGQSMRIVARAINGIALAPCLKKHPDSMTAAQVKLFKNTLANWDTLAAYWFSGPLSLCHGDSHLGNFFVSADEMGMLDFQGLHWGNGIRDVQYFLINSLPADTLAKHERELVRHYVERRRAHGTAIDLDTTWQQYRSFTFHTWMTMVVSIGLAAMNKEQDELMTEMLARAVAAIERVDYARWFEKFIGGKTQS